MYVYMYVCMNELLLFLLLLLTLHIILPRFWVQGRKYSFSQVFRILTVENVLMTLSSYEFL